MTQTPAPATIYDLFPPPQALSDEAWRISYDLITKHRHRLRQYDLERVAWLCAKGPAQLTFKDCQTIHGIYDRVIIV
jgi:hypothetical protein